MRSCKNWMPKFNTFRDSLVSHAGLRTGLLLASVAFGSCRPVAGLRTSKLSVAGLPRAHLRTDGPKSLLTVLTVKTYNRRQP